MLRFLVLLLAISLASAANAVNLPLSAYQANYSLYRGGLNVANSVFSLEQSGRYWRWRQTTRPKGVYRLFSKKIIYAETTLLRIDERYKIHNILLTDESDDDRYENARFIWDRRQIDIQHDNERYLVGLPDEVYDAQSIHLLAAQMLLNNLPNNEFNFYSRGRLAKSKLRRSGKTSLEINRKHYEVIVFEQVTEDSDAIMKYFYDPEQPLLPIKIERIKPDSKSTILLLKTVEWR